MSAVTHAGGHHTGRRLRRAPGVALLALALAGTLPVPALAQTPREPTQSPASTSPAAQPAGSDLTEITVEARRADMRPRLTSFVMSITRTTSRDEALHRWHTPVCPAVLGLPKEQGEFVLARFSQIAREADVKLDGEHCRINLAVVFTSDPDTLIDKWARRRRAFEGVRGTPADFEHFRLGRHPVRVWYNKEFGSPGPVLQGSMSLPRFHDVPTGGGGGSLIGSKLFVKDVLVFSSVAVIVDTREIKDLGIGQVADYVSMVALADTDLEHPLPEAPTILRLFQAHAAGASLPGGVSDWDQAFLKELYSTKLDLITQRSIITNRMLEDLVPRRPVGAPSAAAQ